MAVAVPHFLSESHESHPLFQSTPTIGSFLRSFLLLDATTPTNTDDSHSFTPLDSEMSNVGSLEARVDVEDVDRIDVDEVDTPIQ